MSKRMSGPRTLAGICSLSSETDSLLEVEDGCRLSARSSCIFLEKRLHEFLEPGERGIGAEQGNVGGPKQDFATDGDVHTNAVAVGR